MTNSTGSNMATPAGRRAGPRSKTAALIALGLGFAVIQLDVTVVNVAVEHVGATFGADVSQLQWMVSAYILVFAALILVAGSLGDRIGAKRVFSAGFVVFVLASMACGLAPSMAVLIAARSVQGIGAAALGACSLALLNHTFTEPRERARAIGLWAAGASTALSGGPVVGGILIATLGWRAIFFINVPLGAAGLWLTRRFVTETPKLTERRIDLGGAVAAVTALGAFAGAAIEAGPLGFSSPWVLAGLAVSLLATGAFIWVEAHTANPMLPLALLRQRRFASPIAVGSLVNICFYGLIFVFSLLFQDQHHLSALQAGIAFVPMTAAILATNLVNGKLAAFIGPVRMILLGVAAMTAGCAGLLWTGPGTPYPAMLGQQVLLGAGLGLLVPPMTGLLLASTDRSRSGVASGALTAFRQAGSLLGVALFGSLIAGRHLFYQGLHIALWISIAALVASAAFALLASGPKRDATSVSPGRTVVDPVVEEPAK